MAEYIERENCPMRHENGNCLPAGGFCTAINSEICRALHSAYSNGFCKAIYAVGRKEPAADVVEVVRCKDCQRYGNINYHTGTRFDFKFCNKFGNVTRENDFCSYGERRSE